MLVVKQIMGTQIVVWILKHINSGDYIGFDIPRPHFWGITLGLISLDPTCGITLGSFCMSSRFWWRLCSYTCAVISRQLRILPWGWVQEWQNLYARRYARCKQDQIFWYSLNAIYTCLPFFFLGVCTNWLEYQLSFFMQFLVFKPLDYSTSAKV